MSLDTLLAVIAALAATAFTLDLVNDIRSKGPRPHTVSYAVGIGMFALATWALAAGLAFGWNGAAYRTFFLFGAVLNIPFLALGSVYLVLGKTWGNWFLLFVGALAAISVTLVTTVPFAEPLPVGGVPHQIFPPPSTFGPRLLAAIGAGLGATLLIVLALISLFKFWRTNRRLVAANALILAGTFAASWGGGGLALGQGGAFAVSLLLASTLIWSGYRTARGARAGSPAPVSASTGERGDGSVLVVEQRVETRIFVRQSDEPKVPDHQADDQE